jgi:hypothetical protein
VTRLALTLGLTLMDTCWLAAWAVLLGRFSDPVRGAPLLSAVSILLLQLLAAFTTEHLGRRALTRRGWRIALLSLGVLAVLVAVRIDQYSSAGGLEWLPALGGALALAIGSLSAPVLAFVLGFGIWWRGIQLGRQTSTSIEVESAFHWGIAMLVLFGIVQLLPLRGSALFALQADTTLLVVGFFFVSLLTLALGRLESLSTRTRSVGINSQWLTVLVLISAAIVIAALALGQLISFDLLVTAMRPVFEVLGRLLLVLAYLIVIPIAYVAQFLIFLVLSLIQPDPNRPRPQPLQANDVDSFLQRLFGQGIPPDVMTALKALGALALFALALVIMNRAFRRWRPRGAEAEAAQEERDSVFVARRLRDALLAWLLSLFNRRRALPAAVATAGEQAVTARASGTSVRDLYRELLRIGDSAGVHRAPGTTPLEHQAPLSAALEPVEAIDGLTAAYVEVRYADREVATEGLGDALLEVHVRESD